MTYWLANHSISVTLQRGPTRNPVWVEFSSFHLFEGNYRTNRPINIGNDVFLTTMLYTVVSPGHKFYQDVKKCGQKIGIYNYQFLKFKTQVWLLPLHQNVIQHIESCTSMCQCALTGLMFFICSSGSGRGVASMPAATSHRFAVRGSRFAIPRTVVPTDITFCKAQVPLAEVNCEIEQISIPWTNCIWLAH